MNKVYILSLAFGLLLGACNKKAYLPGYVVTPNLDTLRGRVMDRAPLDKSPRLYKEVRFIDENGRRKKFTPTHITSYARDGQVFVSVPFIEAPRFPKISLGGSPTVEQRFLKVKRSGYLSLYEYEFIDFDGPHYDYIYYIRKEGDDAFVAVPILGFRRAVKKYLSDAIPIVEKVESREYRFRDLFELIDDYNTWKSQQTN